MRSDHSPGESKHQAFSEELTDDARPSGSECLADRQFPSPRRGSGKEQIGDVCARYKQDQRYDGHQDPQWFGKLAAKEESPVAIGVNGTVVLFSFCRFS